jgi:H+/Cl- antiporter ClcA
MKFGHWLNSLGFVEFLSLLIILGMSAYLANISFLIFNNWYTNKQKNNLFANEIRRSPFLFVGITIPFLLILYNILYRYIHTFLTKIF